ncbi:cell division protein FtsL [Eggerthellaceae bacterium 3-80]|nr:cell division protein FtsL [bacterium D16-34]
MGAAPAYSHYNPYTTAPARRPQQTPQPSFTVLPGKTPRSKSAPAASPASFVIKLTVVVLIALTCVACVRLSLSSATAATAMESQQLTASIDEARSNGAALEVSLGSLTNPTRVRDQAKALGMVAPQTTGVITLEEDIVMTDQAGNLSLSSSVEAAHERGV